MCFVVVVLLVMQPAELLKDFGVCRGVIQNSLIGRLGTVELDGVNARRISNWGGEAYIFLLLMNMTYLKPYILLSQRPRGRMHNILKTLSIVSNGNIERVIGAIYL